MGWFSASPFTFLRGGLLVRVFLAALVLLLACSQTYADGRSWGHRPSFHGNGYSHPHGNWGRPGGSWGHQGPNVGGGIIGGMIGSWMWNQFNQPTPPPAPVPDAVQPWTPAWYEYCANRFKTFDSQSGYYNGLDGQRHFCQ